MTNGDLLSFLVENIATIVTVLASAVGIIGVIYGRRKRAQLEAIQAKQKPTVDMEISAKVEKYRGLHFLMLDVTVHNVGEVIAAPVNFTVSLARFDPPAYPPSSLLFASRKHLAFCFNREILYEELTQIRTPRGLDKKQCLFETVCINPCGHYDAKDILDYDYNPGEYRHFIFPVLTTGHGMYRVKLQMLFMRHRLEEGRRTLDVKDTEMVPIKQPQEKSKSKMMRSLLRLRRKLLGPWEVETIGGSAFYGFSEEMIGIIPEPKPEDQTVDSHYELGVSYFSMKEYPRAFREFDMIPESQRAVHQEDLAYFYFRHASNLQKDIEPRKRDLLLKKPLDRIKILVDVVSSLREAVSSIQRAFELAPREDFETLLDSLRRDVERETRQLVDAIRTSEEPWSVIDMIRGVSELESSPEIQAAIKERASDIAEAIRTSIQSLNVISCIEGIEQLTSNEDIQAAMTSSMEDFAEYIKTSPAPEEFVRSLLHVKSIREHPSMKKAIRNKGLYEKFYGASSSSEAG